MKHRKYGLKDIFTEGGRIFFGPVEFMITLGKVIIPEKFIVNGAGRGKVF